MPGRRNSRQRDKERRRQGEPGHELKQPANGSVTSPLLRKGGHGVTQHALSANAAPRVPAAFHIPNSALHILFFHFSTRPATSTSPVWPFFSRSQNLEKNEHIPREKARVLARKRALLDRIPRETTGFFSFWSAATRHRFHAKTNRPERLVNLSHRERSLPAAGIIPETA